MGATLSSLDDDGLIPTFGFGDATSRHFGTLNLGVCRGFEDVLARYRQTVDRKITLSGPTSFAPVIREAIDIVNESGGQYHILLIIADGQVSDALNCKSETIQAIVDASEVPLSIVVVGVGDGPVGREETTDHRHDPMTDSP